MYKRQLWYQPAVVRHTGISAADVPAAFQADVAKGHSEASMEDAATYVTSMMEAVTTSTITTTSTAPAVPSQNTTTTSKSGIAGQIPTDIGPASSTTLAR